MIFGQKDNKHYSLSAAYKKFGNQIRLKFWAYVWSDLAKVRRLMGPLTEECTVSFWRVSVQAPVDDLKDKLRQRLRNRQYPYYVISDIIDLLLTRAISIKDPFFSADCRVAALP